MRPIETSNRFLGAIQITNYDDSPTASEFWSQHNISDVLDHSNLLICYVDNQQIYRYANQPYADFLELPQTKIIGRPFKDLVAQSYNLLNSLNAQKALQGTSQHFEQEVTTKTATKFFHTKYEPDRDAEGNVAGFFVYCDEITHLKKREQNLLRIFDNVTACLFWVDQDLTIKFAGQGGLNHFGFDAKEVMGSTIQQFIGPEAYQIAEPHLKCALEGQPSQYENRTETADGRSLEIQVHCMPDLTSDGQVQGLFVVSFDITSLKTVQRELQRAQQRLNMAVQASQIGIWETDPARDDWFFTDHIEQLWGLEKGSLDNSIRKLDSRIHPQDYSKILEVRRLIEEEKNDHRVQFRALTQTGYRWMQAATFSQFDDQGNLIRRTGTITEIDQLKSAEIKSADEIEQRDLFLSVLSHELRNPMTAIYHAIYYAQETGDLPESLTEIFDILDRQSKQMTRLMDDLLEVSRFNQEKLNFQTTSVDLTQILEQAVSHFTVDDATEYPHLVWQPVDQPLWVPSDRDRLNQAIKSLLSTANKYAKEKAKIQIDLRRHDEKVICSIYEGEATLSVDTVENDLGENQPSGLFPHRFTDGLSIDLFLARCIIRELGGNITVENEGVGKGCAISFWLPYHPPTDQAADSKKAEL